MPEIKDSGARREFETGAVRDDNGMKGRYDLLPLDIVADFFHKDVDFIGFNTNAYGTWHYIYFSKINGRNFELVEAYLIAALRRFIETDVEIVESLHVRPQQIINGEEIPWVPLSDANTAIDQVAKHFQEGANKYGENNWQKGIPVHCYIDSALRHHNKYLHGDSDERHDRAFVWNILCGLWTLKHKPELNDYFDRMDEKGTEKNVHI